MADIPPGSDPQIAALVEQNKKRRARAVLIFGTVGVLLVVGLAGSWGYASVQAKKRRNVAYSRVVKCLFGRPLDPGEAPMTRVRSAWRARILAAKSDRNADLDAQEAKETAEWPNRCVAEMIAFTDTLKDLGEMKEGDKDLGFYSRELSKQTAGQNWKNVDTYQAATEAFLTEAEKGRFDFVDLPDVKPPELADAQPIEVALPKASALDDLHIDPYAHALVQGASVRFFVPAGKGKPARLCAITGNELACTSLALPPEASGVAAVLSGDDDAAPLLAFGGVDFPAKGLFRSADSSAILPPDAFFVIGGYTRKDGTSNLLLKEAGEGAGEHFVVGHAAATGATPKLDKVNLTDWDEQPTSVTMVGPFVVWATLGEELHAVRADVPPKDGKDAIVVAHLPGTLRSVAPFSACHTKSGLFLAARARADLLSRVLVVSVTDAGFGKPQVTDDGDLTCSDDAAVVVESEALVTCNDGGCTPAKIEADSSPGSMAAIGSTVVRVSRPGGLLRIVWSKDGKAVATKVFDAQMKGTVLLGESKLGHATVVGRRDHAVLVADLAGVQHLARLDATGGITPVTAKP